MRKVSGLSAAAFVALSILLTAFPSKSDLYDSEFWRTIEKCKAFPCEVSTPRHGPIIIDGKFSGSAVSSPAQLSFDLKLSSNYDRASRGRPFARVQLKLEQRKGDEPISYSVEIHREPSNPFGLAPEVLSHDGTLDARVASASSVDPFALTTQSAAFYALSFAGSEYESQTASLTGGGAAICIADETFGELGCNTPLGSWSILGIPMPNTPGQNQCCNKHDICYRNGGSSEHRVKCDEEFAACWAETGIGIPLLEWHHAPFMVSLFSDLVYSPSMPGTCRCQLRADKIFDWMWTVMAESSSSVARHSRCCDGKGNCKQGATCQWDFYDSTGWPTMGVMGQMTKCHAVDSELLCGDGAVDPTIGEECDPPGGACGNGGTCRNDCTCDEPPPTPTPTPTPPPTVTPTPSPTPTPPAVVEETPASVITPRCGNGIVERGEQCEGENTQCTGMTPSGSGTCKSCRCIDNCVGDYCYDVERPGLTGRGPAERPRSELLSVESIEKLLGGP